MLSDDLALALHTALVGALVLLLAPARRVQTIFDEHRSLLREGRKAFAVHVKEQHPDEKHLLFALLDNKDIAPTIMARLDAEAICAASAAGDIEA
jgi:hypothetical protein